MLNTLLLSFKSLRALDFHGLKITRVPNSIGKLIHLKYLDLTYSTIETLPDSITRLWNLQTLKLKGCRILKNYPKTLKPWSISGILIIVVVMI
jgi:Leucine-rich repeat (LRR) protein